MTKLFVRPEPYDGRLLGWELSLANYAMSKVVSAGTRHSLVTLHSYTKKPCVLFSAVGDASVLVLALYDLADQLPWHLIVRDRYEPLVDEWSKYCAAYVVAEFHSKPRPHFLCLSSAAIAKAAEELESHFVSEFPALSQIDQALGSELVRSALWRTGPDLDKYSCSSLSL